MVNSINSNSSAHKSSVNDPSIQPINHNRTPIQVTPVPASDTPEILQGRKILSKRGSEKFHAALSDEDKQALKSKGLGLFSVGRKRFADAFKAAGFQGLKGEIQYQLWDKKNSEATSQENALLTARAVPSKHVNGTVNVLSEGSLARNYIKQQSSTHFSTNDLQPLADTPPEIDSQYALENFEATGRRSTIQAWVDNNAQSSYLDPHSGGDSNIPHPDNISAMNSLIPEDSASNAGRPANFVITQDRHDQTLLQNENKSNVESIIKSATNTEVDSLGFDEHTEGVSKPSEHNKNISDHNENKKKELKLVESTLAKIGRLVAGGSDTASKKEKKISVFIGSDLRRLSSYQLRSDKLEKMLDKNPGAVIIFDETTKRNTIQNERIASVDEKIENVKKEASKNVRFQEVLEDPASSDSNSVSSNQGIYSHSDVSGVIDDSASDLISLESNEFEALDGFNLENNHEPLRRSSSVSSNSSKDSFYTASTQSHVSDSSNNSEYFDAESLLEEETQLMSDLKLTKKIIENPDSDQTHVSEKLSQSAAEKQLFDVDAFMNDWKQKN